jgi:antitoxin component of RelBE/YafQ-DinJ toxin-antitoxin module
MLRSATVEPMHSLFRARVEGELLKKAETVAKGLGLTSQDLLRMTLAAVVRCQGIPAGLTTLTPEIKTAPKPEAGGRSKEPEAVNRDASSGGRPTR